MRNGLLLTLVAGLAIAGCTAPDENPTWNPNEQYPPAAYNRPYYLAPVVEPQPTEKIGNNIPIYYMRDSLVFIKHPGGQQPCAEPQMALYYSTNGGTVWSKAGYYGYEQTHFDFNAPTDGRYWIRFVGPGQGTADVPPGQPHRVYVVDTHAPKINMTVSPSPWMDKDRKVPRQFHVGQEVVLHWTVDDKHLLKDSIQLATCYAQFPHNLVWSEFGERMGPVGAVRVMIPPEAAHQAGLRFRIIAKDKADNIGIALSEILPVTADPLPEAQRPPIADLGPAVPSRSACEPSPEPVETAVDPEPLERLDQPVDPSARPGRRETTPKPQPQPGPAAAQRKAVAEPRCASAEPAPKPVAVSPKPPSKPKPAVQKPEATPKRLVIRPDSTITTPRPRRATIDKTDAAPPVTRTDDMADIERRMTDLKKRRDAEQAKARQLSPMDPAREAARPDVDRTDEVAGVQRTTRRPTITTRPAPLTDPIHIQPADKAADVAPPGDLLERVVVEGTPVQPRSAPHRDAAARPASPRDVAVSQPELQSEPKQVVDRPADRESMAGIETRLAAQRRHDAGKRHQGASLQPARPGGETVHDDQAPTIVTETPTPAPHVAPTLKPQPAPAVADRRDEAPRLTWEAPTAPVAPALNPQPAPAVAERRDEAPAATRQSPTRTAPVDAKLQPRPAPADAPRQDETPEIAIATPRRPQPGAPTLTPRPARDETPRSDEAMAGDTGETIAEIEARMAAARKRYEQAKAAEQASQDTDRAPARPGDEPLDRDEAPEPVVDAEEIAEAVVELPSPNPVKTPRRDEMPAPSVGVTELEPARPVPAKPAVQPTPADEGPADISAADLAEIERRMAKLKRKRDAGRALTAQPQRPYRAAVTKTDEATVVQIDRAPRQRLDVPTEPHTAETTATAGRDADVNPLLRPIDVDRAVQRREGLAADNETDPVAIAAATPRRDETPGPVLRTDRRRPTPKSVADESGDDAPVALVELPRPEAPRNAAKPAGSATVTHLGDVPESVQQGWPASGMTLRGGVNRLLSWLPEGTDKYTFVELQFSSDNGRKWVTVANGLRSGRAAMWNVPKISAENCRLRILGRDGRGGEDVLAISEPFKVDNGLWETVDLSGTR
jgi:hypothetical protein